MTATQAFDLGIGQALFTMRFGNNKHLHAKVAAELWSADLAVCYAGRSETLIRDTFERALDAIKAINSRTR